MARNDHEQAKASGELQRRHETLPAERERLIREKIELERQLEAEQEYIVNKLQKQTAGLAREKDALRADREELRRQVERLLSDKIRLRQEKAQLENTMEAEEEHIVNRLQCQMLELYQRNVMLQRRLDGSATPSVVSESDASEDEGEVSARGARPRTAPRTRTPAPASRTSRANTAAGSNSRTHRGSATCTPVSEGEDRRARRRRPAPADEAGGRRAPRRRRRRRGLRRERGWNRWGVVDGGGDERRWE